MSFRSEFQEWQDELKGVRSSNAWPLIILTAAVVFTVGVLAVVKMGALS